jgi:hypothetical protein
MEGILLSAILFIACLVLVFIFLLTFLQDTNLSLLALKLELGAKAGHVA